MKMAKPSERDIDAAGKLMSLLHQLDRGDYPNLDENADVPDWFDEHDIDHLRAFYDAVKSTLDKGPGYPGRVIGGMCYVIMYDKNEIVDPASDTLDLHPKIVAALQAADTGTPAAPDEVQWINIDDARKPIGRTPILVAVDYVRYGEYEDGTPGEFRGQIVAEGEYVPQHGEAGNYFTCFSSPHGDSEAITHWMPLPAAPEFKTNTPTGADSPKGDA